MFKALSYIIISVDFVFTHNKYTSYALYFIHDNTFQ